MNTVRFKRKIRRGQHTPPTPGDVLTAADFTYLGSDTINNSLGEGIAYSKTFTHRYKDGELRFFIVQNDNTLREFRRPAAPLGQTITSADRVNYWTADAWSFRPALDGPPLQGVQAGMHWEDLGGGNNRVCVCVGADYPGAVSPNFPQPPYGSTYSHMTSAVYTMVLHDGNPGTVSDYNGTYGFEGVSQRCVMGKMLKNPQWFQDLYGVGPYMYGQGGGGVSLSEQGGTASFGLFLIAGPDVTNGDYAPANYWPPTGYNGDGADFSIPVADFKILADHRNSVGWYDDYTGPGYVPPHDRSVRVNSVFNAIAGQQDDSNVPGLWSGGDATLTFGSDSILFSVAQSFPAQVWFRFNCSGGDLNGQVAKVVTVPGAVVSRTAVQLTEAWPHETRSTTSGTVGIDEHHVILSPPNVNPAAPWQFPSPDTFNGGTCGRFTDSDSFWNLAAWVDGPNKKGFLALANTTTGTLWYHKPGNSVSGDQSAAELHIYDPATLGAAANGLIGLSNVQPSDIYDMTSILRAQGVCTSEHGQEGNAPVSLTFDATTNRLWVLSIGVGVSDGFGSLLSCWEVNC